MDGTEPTISSPPPPRGIRGHVLVTLAVCALCLALKLPGLGAPHRESDEQIYWVLAQKLALGMDYSLRGTNAADGSSRKIYDRPLFHHPPLFMIMIAPLAKANLPAVAMLLPWFAHAICIVAVAMMLFGLQGALQRDGGAASPCFWLPLLGVALDPVLTLTASKLWTDAPLAAWCALSVATCWLAVRRGGSTGLFVLSGLLLGCACLTKITGAGVAVVCAGLILMQPWPARKRATALLLGAAPAALLTGLWLARFHREYGMFLPDWIAADQDLIRRYPFVRLVMSRPPWFYALQTTLLAPVVLLGVWGLARHWRGMRDIAFTIPALWIAVYFGALTWIGVTGMGFQMRYLAPMFPAVYLLLGATLLAAGPRARALQVLAGLAIAVGVVPGQLSNMHVEIADLSNLLEIARLIRPM